MRLDRKGDILYIRFVSRKLERKVNFEYLYQRSVRRESFD
jgi:hypothetical protein